MKIYWCIAALAVSAACGKPRISELEVPGPDGGSDAGTAPTLHAALTLILTYSDPQFILARPTGVDGVLTLEQAGRDVHGTLALFGQKTTITSLVEVKGTLDGTSLSLEAGQAGASPFGTLGWKTFTLDLQPGGTGSVAGLWRGFGGDVIDESDYTAQVAVSKDTAGDTTAIEPLIYNAYRGALLPVDGLRVRVLEPVGDAAARANVRLLAGGQPQTGSITTASVDGRITTLDLLPAAWLPFDTEVTLDVGALADPAGNAISAPKNASRTVKDPGTLLLNPDFELGLMGWATVAAVGRVVSTVTEFNSVKPVSGSNLLLIREDSAAAGWVDVPASATRLTFSAALLSEIGQYDVKRTATVTLYVAGSAPQVIFDAAAESAKTATCDTCNEFRSIIPFAQYEIDVKALQGKRVMVVAEARSSYFIGLTQYALLVDDLRLQ